MWILIEVLVKERNISMNIGRSIKNVSKNIKSDNKKYLVVEYVSKGVKNC